MLALTVLHPEATVLHPECTPNHRELRLCTWNTVLLHRLLLDTYRRLDTKSDRLRGSPLVTWKGLHHVLHPMCLHVTTHDLPRGSRPGTRPPLPIPHGTPKVEALPMPLGLLEVMKVGSPLYLRVHTI